MHLGWWVNERFCESDGRLNRKQTLDGVGFESSLFTTIPGLDVGPDDVCTPPIKPPDVDLAFLSNPLGFTNQKTSNLSSWLSCIRLEPLLLVPMSLYSKVQPETFEWSNQIYFSSGIPSMQISAFLLEDIINFCSDCPVSSISSWTFESNKNFWPFNKPERNNNFILGTIDFEET